MAKINKKNRGVNMPAGRSAGKISTQIHYSLEKMAEEMAGMSRLELLKSAFFSHSAKIPTMSNGELTLIDPFILSFSVGEILSGFTAEEFTRWAEDTGHPDIEKQDAFEFFKVLDTPDVGNRMITIHELRDLLESFLNSRCPAPSTGISSSFHFQSMEQKDYYLPALKVLNEDNSGCFWSPTFSVPWYENELSARHMLYGSHGPSGNADFVHDGKSAIDALSECHCGIYASVNLDELEIYLLLEANNPLGWSLDERFATDRRRLCIIEPYVYAAVFMARKGWKASRAFISEVVGETISPQDASTLLSMTWNRKIDVTRLYSQMRRTHESW